MLIPKKYKALVTCCTDCHNTYATADDYPCMIYKVCPLHVPGVFYLGKQGKGKQVRSCYRIGSDCDCM